MSTDQAPTLIMSPEHEELAIFSSFLYDDMVWLGGRHDGYCHTKSLSAYIWLRFSTAKTCREQLALWQSALSFGVLEAVTGMHIPESFLLVSCPDGSTVLSSNKLSLLVHSFLFGTVFLYASEWDAEQTCTVSTVVHSASLRMREAWRVLETEGWIGTGLDEHELDEIICSLSALPESLLHPLVHRIVAFKKSGDLNMSHEVNVLLPEVRAPPHWQGHRFTYRMKQLMENGWCPYTIADIMHSSFLVWCARNAHPFKRSFFPEEHMSCTDRHCTAHDLDTTEYTTQHVPTCHSQSVCPFLSPSIVHVSDLLMSKEIPVMIYDGRALTVRNAADGPYVAISHV